MNYTDDTLFKTSHKKLEISQIKTFLPGGTSMYRIFYEIV